MFQKRKSKRLVNVQRLVFILALLFMGYIESDAQTKEIPEDNRKKVYLIVRGEESLPPENKDLPGFVGKLLNYQLKSLKGTPLILNVSPLECKELKTQPQQAEQSSTINSATVSSSLNYYYIQVSIDFRKIDETASSLILDYALTKYENCSPKILFQQKKPIEDKLENLIAMSDILSAFLEQELRSPRKTVNFTNVRLTNSTIPEIFKKELLEHILTQVSSEGDFDVRDPQQVETLPPANYTITTQMSLTPEKRLKATIQIKSANENSNNPIPPVRVEKPINLARPNDRDLSAFYEDAAKKTLNLLKEMNFAAEANIEGMLTTIPPSALKAKVRQLMCQSKECEPQYEAAIPLLDKLTTQLPVTDSDRADLFFLLGQAYDGKEEYAKAAQAFDKAWKSRNDQSNESLTYLNNAAYSWFRAKNYEIAAERFESYIKSGRQELGPYIQRARSYLFAGKRLDSLTALMGGLKAFPDKTKQSELEKELDYLIDDFRGLDEFEKAEIILTENKQYLPDGKDEIHALLKRWAPELISATEEAYSATNSESEVIQKRSYEEMEARLQKLGEIYKKHEEKVSGSVEEDRLRLLGIFFRENPYKRDLTQAIQFLVEAVGLKKKKENECRYELAITYVKRVKEIEKSDTLLAEEFTEKAKIELAYLVTQNYHEASGVLLLLAETKALKEVYKDVSKVLGMILIETLTEANQAILYFYQFWAGMAQNKKEDSNDAFQKWQETLARKLRKDNKAIGWKFESAVQFLTVTQATPADLKGKLLEMIEAMKNQDTPLPKPLP